jgi:PAS domain S-box-containing protein
MKMSKLKIVLFIFITSMCIGSYFHVFRLLDTRSEFFFSLSYIHLGILFLTLMLFFINDSLIFKIRQRILLSSGIVFFIGIMVIGWLFTRFQIGFYLNRLQIIPDAGIINDVFRNYLFFSEVIVLLLFFGMVFFILYNFQQLKNLRRLDELNHLNRKLFNSTGLPLMMIGDDKIQSFNPETVRQFGYSSKEFKKLNPKSLFKDDQIYEKQNSILRQQSSVDFETDCRMKDGTYFKASVHLSLFTERDKQYYILVVKNISGIIKNLQATELLNLVFNTLLSEASWEDTFPDIQKVLGEYFSCETFYIYLQTYEGLFEFGSLTETESILTREFSIDYSKMFETEISGDKLLILSRISTPKQHYGFLFLKMDPHLFDELAASTIKNISRIIAEVLETDTLFRELDNSEKTYRTLVDHSLSGIYLMQENRILIANSKFYEITGYSEEDLENNIDPSILFHPDSDIEVKPNVQKAGIIDENQGILYTFKGLKKDRTVRWFSAYESIIEYNHKPAVLAHLLDITSQIENEEQKKKMTALMIQQQKMETMKNLVAGISHEYNNIFAIIKGYAELLLYSVKSPDIRNAEEDISNITQAVERGIKITNRMHVFARHEQITKRPLDLHDFFKSLEPVFQNMVRKKNTSITLKMSAATERFILDTDEVGLEEILYNLLRNSIDAVSETGVIAINAYQPDPGHIRIDISDNGTGISKTDLPNIFDPFFTTKDPQYATGLGLYIVFELSKALDADISVESKPGNGTTVSLLFNL